MDRTLLEKCVTQLREIQRIFKQQAAKAVPANIPKNEVDSYLDQTKWLNGVAEKSSLLERDISALLTRLAKTNDESMISRRAQMNKQFLALQEAMQMESRRFQTLSNASKARHDVALSAIHNMK